MFLMRAQLVLFLVGTASLCSFGPSFGQVGSADADSAFLAQTQLVGLSFYGLNSGTVRQAARQGFELSNGTPADLAFWYSPQFPNISAVFATDLGRGVSLIWGGSIGERGPKYSLDPSGVVGILLRQPMGPRAELTFQVYGQFGGALRESPCLGDYGALGGIQAVNCRLAASILPPVETLGYLWNTAPTAQATAKLTYELRF